MPPFPKFIHPQITVYYNQPQIHNNKYIYSYPPIIHHKVISIMQRPTLSHRRSTPQVEIYSNYRISWSPKDRRIFYSSLSSYLSYFGFIANSTCFSRAKFGWIILFSGARKNCVAFSIFSKKLIVKARSGGPPLSLRDFVLPKCQKFLLFANITHRF